MLWGKCVCTLMAVGAVAPASALFGERPEAPMFCHVDQRDFPALPDDFALPAQVPNAPLFRELAGPVAFFCAEDLFDDCQIRREEDTCAAAFFRECSECFLTVDLLVNRTCACDCADDVEIDCEPSLSSRRTLEEVPDFSDLNFDDFPLVVRLRLLRLLDAAQRLGEFAQCVRENSQDISTRCKAAIAHIRNERNRGGETDDETLEAAAVELYESLESIVPSPASTSNPSILAFSTIFVLFSVLR